MNTDACWDFSAIAHDIWHEACGPLGGPELGTVRLVLEGACYHIARRLRDGHGLTLPHLGRIDWAYSDGPDLIRVELPADPTVQAAE